MKKKSMIRKEAPEIHIPADFPHKPMDLRSVVNRTIEGEHMKPPPAQLQPPKLAFEIGELSFGLLVHSWFPTLFDEVTLMCPTAMPKNHPFALLAWAWMPAGIVWPTHLFVCSPTDAFEIFGIEIEGNPVYIPPGIFYETLLGALQKER